MRLHSKLIRWSVVALITLLVGLIALAPAMAQGPQTGGDITVDQDSPDDLYLAGDHVTVNSTIDGDLLVVARTLTLNGTVKGDLLFAGQSLIVNGKVEDDARVAGMVLLFKKSSQVGDDLNAAGYAVEMEPGSQAGGKAYAAGYMVSLAEVGGDVSAAANGVRLLGPVGGDVTAFVGDDETSGYVDPGSFAQRQDVPPYTHIPSGLSFGDDASVSGNLNYTSTKEYPIPAGKIKGKVTFTKEVEPSTTQTQTRPNTVFARRLLRTPGFFAVSFVLMFGLGLLLNQFAPQFLNGSLEAMRRQTGRSIGFGILGYIVFIGGLMVLGFFTIVLFIPLVIIGGGGPFLGLMALIGLSVIVSFGAVTSWIAPLLMALLIGDFLYAQLNHEKRSFVWALVIGLLLVTVMLASPVGSWLVGLALGIFGLGAVVVYLSDRGKPRQISEPVRIVESTPAAPVEEIKPARKRASKKSGE